MIFVRLVSSEVIRHVSPLAKNVVADWLSRMQHAYLSSKRAMSMTSEHRNIEIGCLCLLALREGMDFFKFSLLSM